MERCDVVGNLDIIILFAILELVDAIGRREHIDLAKFATEKSVQQRRFAGFNLANDDKQEWLAEVRNQVLQVAQSVFRRPDLVGESRLTTRELSRVENGVRGISQRPCFKRGSYWRSPVGLGGAAL